MPYLSENIGEYLKNKGLLTPAQLEDALNEQKTAGGYLGEILIKKGYISEIAFTQCLSEQLGISFVDLQDYVFDPKAVEKFPKDLAQKYQAVPLYKVAGAITVAMVDPLNIIAVDAIKKACGTTIRPVFATATGIKQAITQLYGEEIDVSHLPAGTAAKEKESDKDLESLVKEASEGPVVNMVNSLFADALEAIASDIHLEPEEDKMYVRLRLDGVLQDVKPIPNNLAPAVISRIKILANMDIAEKRLPQDGRIKMKIKNKDIDLRISTFPTIHGENMAIRILDKSQALMELKDLGFKKDILKQFKEEVNRPHGIILVTGPTGSGKTTSLYAVLNIINDVGKNIITLEDPVEYVIPRVRQAQLNVKAGLTFATGLRSILRHDPDIIMIGEIRDRETAEISIHSALTGHLVFSTLHTNDAPSAASRLIDMGIEPFLIASALNAILAQRLVRCLCAKCKKEYKPTDAEIEGLGLDKNVTVYEPVGCKECRSTGYKGRIGVFELLVIDEKIKELILEKAPAHQIREQAVNQGMRTLRDDAIDKLLGGITSISEVLRVSEEM